MYLKPYLSCRGQQGRTEDRRWVLQLLAGIKLLLICPPLACTYTCMCVAEANITAELGAAKASRREAG
jgi:hypothetical protein